MSERTTTAAVTRRSGAGSIVFAAFLALLLALGFFACPKVWADLPSYDEIAVGDTVTFGRFEQDNNEDNGPEPIAWRVLDKEDGKVLIITDKALEMMPFFAIYWKHSSIGGYINSSFLADFTAEEKDMLVKTLITSDKHPDKPETDQGSETENKLFLLSVDEAKKYFADDKDRICYASKFVIEYEGLKAQSDSRCDWWLRTAYDNWSNGALIANVDPNGYINVSSHRARLGLRPACWVQLAE